MGWSEARSSGWGTALLVGLPVLLGALLAAPHLGDELWYDEAYTLDFFATGELLLPFRDYHAPNNHVLWSAALGQWRALSPSTDALRVLPALCFLSAIALIVLGTRRLFGPAAALIAGAVFASSHVTLNFALQLRGYGPSWLPVALAWWAIATPAPLSRGRRLAVLASTVVAVGILPTNLLVFATLAAWRGAALLLVPGRALGRRDRWVGALTDVAPFAMGAVLGLGWYVGALDQMAASAQQFQQTTPLRFALEEWFVPLGRDFGWTLPALVVGAWLTGRAAWRDEEPSPRGPTSRGLLVAGVILVPWLLMGLAPQRPATRVLVPLLPLVGVAIAVLLVDAWKHLPERLRVHDRRATLVLFAVMAIAGFQRELSGAGYDQRHAGEDPRVMDLYDLYIHHDFHPRAALDWLDARARERPLTVFLDRSDLWAVVYLGKTEHRDRLWTNAYVALHDSPELSDAQIRKLLEDRELLLLTRGAENAEQMRRVIVRSAPAALAPAGPPVLLHDTGYFEIYALSPPAG